MPVFQDASLRRRLEAALEGRPWQTLGGARGEAVREVRDECLAEMKGLLHPAMAYETYPIRGAEEGALIVGEGHRLASPVAAKLFGAGREVVLLAYTIGPGLEARVAEYRAAGDALHSYMLDALSYFAIRELGKIAHGQVKDLAAARKLRASVPLNPGTSHWPMAGQALFLSLIPAAAIGLSVAETGLLYPTKSISMALALGEDVLTDEEGSSCDYCDQPELCRDAGRRLHASVG